MNMKQLVKLQAEPKPLEIDLQRTAIVIVDMQNAFASKGGMFDLWGFDISGIPRVVEAIQKIIQTAREKDIKIIYIAHRLSPDLREVGHLSPFSQNNKVLESYREKPAMRDKILLRGTWGAEIIDELKPKTGEILIEKRRYSAFAGTDLDMTLRTFDIRYLVFVGVATNICVESSLRDAFHREYFPILISDAAAASPPSRQEATIGNIKQVFGWVTTSENIVKAMEIQ
jgi:ureidoacrylate peracid hydrolase